MIAASEPWVRNQLLRFLVRKRAKEDGVHCRKNGAVRTNPQGQAHYGQQCEAGTSRKHSQAVAQVLKHAFPCAHSIFMEAYTGYLKLRPQIFSRSRRGHSRVSDRTNSICDSEPPGKKFALRCGLKLGGELIDGGHVVEGGEIGVAGERVALFSVDQNFHFQNSGSVGGDGVDQGRHCQFSTRTPER